MVPLGRLLATPGALAAFERNPTVGVADYVRRHLTGDWGDVDREDWAANDRAVRDGTRVIVLRRVSRHFDLSRVASGSHRLDIWVLWIGNVYAIDVERVRVDVRWNRAQRRRPNPVFSLRHRFGLAAVEQFSRHGDL